VIEPLEILTRLVRTPSETGAEAEIIRETAALCEALDLRPEVSPDGLVFRVESEVGGPTLLFCSHLDTIAAGEGWARSPVGAPASETHLYGHGVVDAKASCAAILATFGFYARGGLPRGQIVGALSIGGEGNDPSLPRLLRTIGHLDGGIVGEPTQMQIAASQVGLMMVELTARGERSHVSRASGENAIHALLRDLQTLRDLRFQRRDEKQGRVKITPTRLVAGVADSVTPPTAHALLDIRVTQQYDHEEVLEILRGAVASELRVLSDRWSPCETPESEPLVVAARAALPDARVYASDESGDWAFLEELNVPAIKGGPGNPALAHGAGERIALEAFERGVVGYIRLAKTCLMRLDSPDDY